MAYLPAFSQGWFATPQEVLHADWQEVWHSPQPPFLIVLCNFLVFKVFTCFILKSPFLLFLSKRYLCISGGTAKIPKENVSAGPSGSYLSDIITQESSYEKHFFLPRQMKCQYIQFLILQIINGGNIFTIIRDMLFGNKVLKRLSV